MLSVAPLGLLALATGDISKLSTYQSLYDPQFQARSNMLDSHSVILNFQLLISTSTWSSGIFKSALARADSTHHPAPPRWFPSFSPLFAPKEMTCLTHPRAPPCAPMCSHSTFPLPLPLAVNYLKWPDWRQSRQRVDGQQWLLLPDHRAGLCSLMCFPTSLFYLSLTSFQHLYLPPTIL